MKQLQIELADKRADEVKAAAENGWVRSESEVIQAALLEYVRRHRYELVEQDQREDIAWALKQQTNQETPTCRL